MASALPKLKSGFLGLRQSAARTTGVSAVSGSKLLCQCHCQKRTVHNSPIWRSKAGEKREPGALSKGSKKQHLPFEFNVSDLNSSERAQYEAFSPNEQKIFREERKKIYDYFTSPEVESEMQGEISNLVNQTELDAPHVDVQRPRIPRGFWNMGEANREAAGIDEEFMGDDLTELGHAELEQHRELRHYARIAAWEMPLLSSMSL